MKLTERQIKCLNAANKPEGIRVPSSNRVGSARRSFIALKKKGLVSEVTSRIDVFELTDAGRAALQANIQNHGC